MQHLIYYPGFEIVNQIWLKFALLYINKLNPIIPPSGNILLTELHKKLCNETDLIDEHKPKYNEGEKATLYALETADKILRRPYWYRSIFGTKKFIEKWKNPKYQKYKLFYEKYTADWEKFCVNEGLARNSENGILVNQDLGMIYMTILAQTIADGRGISPITDNNNLDKFLTFINKNNQSFDNNYKIKKRVIELELPKNLQEISIDNIISFRNQNNFKTKQNAFHLEIEKFIENSKGNPNPHKFKRTMNSNISDYFDELLPLGTGIAAIGIGVWILVSSNIPDSLQYAEKITGGLSTATGSYLAIKSIAKSSRNKRFNRKFLSDLSKLK